MPHQLKVFTLR
ncbi:unnamed protein product, partial [Rotaria sp. Silwood1]